MTHLSRLTRFAALVGLAGPSAAYAASTEISLFDWKWLLSTGGSSLAAMLIAVLVVGGALSMLAAFIFRAIALKFADVPVTFSLSKGAAFFAIAFLAVQGLTIACLAVFDDMSPSSAFSTTVVFQVAGGVAVALAAREILLRVTAREVSDFRMLGMTFGTYCVFLIASPVISLVIGLAASILAGAFGH